MAIDIMNVTAGGAKFEYFTFGEGVKNLIIIPGLSIKSIMLYKETIPNAFSIFKKEFKVYVFDRRLNLPDSYTIEDMAKDMISVFDELGLKDLSLYGISQGGMIALDITLMRPDLISALILGSTASRISAKAQKNIEEWNRYAREKNEEALVEAFASKVYSRSFYEKYGSVIKASVGGITDEEFKRLVILTDKLNDFDCFDRLIEIECPVLILAGSEDEVLGLEASIEMQDKLLCDMHVFDGYGHAVYDENEEFKERGKEFLLKTLI